MKLKSVLPERPSFVLLAPMLNFLIILGLVMTRGAALDRVKISADEAPFVLAADEEPFFVAMPRQAGARFYLDREPFDRIDQLAATITELRESAARQGVVRDSVIVDFAPQLDGKLRDALVDELVEEGFQVAVMSLGAENDE